MSARRALITGITGQTGSYLADILLEQGYEVHGAVRRGASERAERIDHLRGHVTLHRCDVLDGESLRSALCAAEPDEVYNLAGLAGSSAAWAQPVLSAEVNALGVVRLLEALRAVRPRARFLQASCAEMFGRPLEAPQTERTTLAPCSPLGAAKAHGHLATALYREAHGLHAVSAILFNHASPRQRLDAVVRRITWHAAAIKLGVVSELCLGALEAERDWGFALDYARALAAMLRHDEPEDFVIATGTAHSVRDCLEIAFDHAGVSVEAHVGLDPALRRPAEVEHLVGDASKAQHVLGWRPDVDFADLVRMMVEADYAMLRYDATVRGRAG